jgi:hypothetical protein
VLVEVGRVDSDIGRLLVVWLGAVESVGLSEGADVSWAGMAGRRELPMQGSGSSSESRPRNRQTPRSYIDPRVGASAPRRLPRPIRQRSSGLLH